MPVQSHYRICPLCEACCGLEVQTRRRQGASASAVRTNDVLQPRLHLPQGRGAEGPARRSRPPARAAGQARRRLRRGRAGTRPSPRSSGAAAAHRREHGPRRGRRWRSATRPRTRWACCSTAPRLARALGTRERVLARRRSIRCRSSCRPGWMFGHWLSIPVPDIERTDYLLMLGANPVASNGSLWTVPDFRGKAKALRARGGRLVVIDPRRTETAAVADDHLSIRPGGDAFLLAGDRAHAVRREPRAARPPRRPCQRRWTRLRAAVAAVRARARRRALRHRRPATIRDARARARGRAERAARLRPHRHLHAGASARSRRWLVDVHQRADRPPRRARRRDVREGRGVRRQHAGAAGSGKGITIGRRRSRVSRRARGVRRAADHLPGRGDRDARRRARSAR